MNESLMSLAYSDKITLDEAYDHAVDKQDMNVRVNSYLLDRVEERLITPVEAVDQAYFKPGMLDVLKTAGYSKAVQNYDLSKFEGTATIVE